MNRLKKTSLEMKYTDEVGSWWLVRPEFWKPEIKEQQNIKYKIKYVIRYKV